MRKLDVFLLSIASLCLSGCATVGAGRPPAIRWTTGFWFWQGSALAPDYSGQPVDTLFVQVGGIRKKDASPFQVRGAEFDREPAWIVSGEFPHDLPVAREYWLVFRYERQGVPDVQVAPMLAGAVSQLTVAARARNLNVAGVQLDIDSPTARLATYAAFLREVRQQLPRETGLSITALLDWFRPGTDLAAVLDQVDEFVPQFYDAGKSPELRSESAIAEPIDAARWGPAFNRFHKRFRIGISSFGRARVIPRSIDPQAASAPSHSRGIVFYSDVRPLDVALNPAFQLHAARNAARELVLSYRATRQVQLARSSLAPGDTVQFVVGTPEAIRAAAEEARRMGGYTAGVVFFRWPAGNEPSAMQPDEVLDAANGVVPEHAQHRIRSVEGPCAAVYCADVYLETNGPLSPAPTHCRIRASAELEYFLPDGRTPARLAGPSLIELSLPPYCARGHVYLGRAVSLKHPGFTVEVHP